MRHAVRIAESFHFQLTSYYRICSAVLLLAALITACSQDGDLSAKTPIGTPPPVLVTPPPPTFASGLTSTPAAVATTSPVVPRVFPTAPGGNALVERGRAAFASNCFECHTDLDGNPGLPPKYEKLTKKYITTTVHNGLTIACCQFMAPNNRISDEDLRAIVAYLRSIQPETFADAGD